MREGERQGKRKRLELKKEEQCPSDSSDDEALDGQNGNTTCKNSCLKDPPVYAGDLRIAVPLGPGINPSFTEIEENIAFCCKICRCSEALKQKFLKMDDEVVRPGDNSLWHRRCCHRAFEVKEDWVTDYRHAIAVVENKLLRGDFENVINSTTNEKIDEVHRRYQMTKAQESELHNDDHIEEPCNLLQTNSGYASNQKWFNLLIQGSQGKPKRKAVVIDLFGGIGGSLVCLKRLQIAIKTVIHVENDKVANVVFQKWHGTNEMEIIMVEQFEEFEENIGKFLEKWGPFDIVVGGPPCVDYTGINSRGQGIHGHQGSYLCRMGKLVQKIQRFGEKCGQPCFFLAENAALWDDKEKALEDTDLTIIKKAFNVSWHLNLDSRDHTPLRRNRSYISNIPMGQQQRKDPPPSTCFDGDSEDKSYHYDVAGKIFEPDMEAIKAPGLMAHKNRLDDRPRMLLYRERKGRSKKGVFQCRTPTVVERERLMGFFEKYVSSPVNDLFYNLIEKGFERDFTIKKWNHPTEGLPVKFHMFAGNYHNLTDEFKPFQFRTNSLPIEIALSPPLTTKTPQYYDREEYAKRLIGNSFCIPTVEFLLQPLRGLFQEQNYDTFDYPFAWTGFENENYAREPSDLIKRVIKREIRGRLAPPIPEESSTRSASSTKTEGTKAAGTKKKREQRKVKLESKKSPSQLFDDDDDDFYC